MVSGPVAKPGTTCHHQERGVAWVETVSADEATTVRIGGAGASTGCDPIVGNVWRIETPIATASLE